MRDIFTFLLGAAVGAIFALLYAPQTGAETRRSSRPQLEKIGKSCSCNRRLRCRKSRNAWTRCSPNRGRQPYKRLQRAKMQVNLPSRSLLEFLGANKSQELKRAWKIEERVK